MKHFNYPADLRLDPSSHEKLKYNKKISFFKNNHLGQLKLFSNELEFILSYCCDANIFRKKKIILYIGAGPGNHLVYLAKMFPTFEWHLFDCRFDSKLESVKNVFLERKYFDDTSLETYQNLIKNEDIDLYLISDIRNLSYNSNVWNAEEELKILEDMALQKSWVEALKPKFSMLKFRLLFPEPEIIERIGDKVPYLYGTIYKQPWAGGKSTETRLIVSGDDIREVNYSLSDHEEQMFYHNSVLRQKDYIFPLSDILNGRKVSKNMTVNRRYDCAYIITLLYQYFHRSKPDIDMASLEAKIVKILNVISEYHD